MQKANLEGAYLEDADLSGAHFEEEQIDDQPNWAEQEMEEYELMYEGEHHDVFDREILYHSRTLFKSWG